jgi:hypothetical protein
MISRGSGVERLRRFIVCAGFAVVAGTIPATVRAGEQPAASRPCMPKERNDMSAKIDEARAAEVIARENDRIAGLTKPDPALLRSVLADDLSYVHTNGLHDGKEDIIRSVETRLRYLSVTRDHLQVRFYGDLAVMTGGLHLAVKAESRTEPIVLDAYATQLWIDTPEGWKLAASHANAMPGD